MLDRSRNSINAAVKSRIEILKTENGTQQYLRVRRVDRQTDR